MARLRLTNANIRSIQQGQRVTDTELQGFCANGIKDGVSFSYRYASPILPGRHFEVTIGSTRDGLTVEKARSVARQHAGVVANGRDPKIEINKAREAQAHADNAPTVVSAVTKYFESGAVGELRSKLERERFFTRWIVPSIGSEQLHSLKRATLTNFLETVRTNAGIHVETKASRYLSAFFNWYAIKDDQFRTPMVKGMVKFSPKKHARSHTLSPVELRDIFLALEATEEPFASIVRMLFLSAARRSEISELRWGEVLSDRLRIPAERMKANEVHEIPLTDDIRAIIGRFYPKAGKPKITNFVFTTTGGAKAFSGFSKAKARLDARIAAIRTARAEDDPLPDWRLHDIRRTARTLMSESDVPADIAERVLAHTLDIVRGTYDIHKYFEPKHAALNSLSARIKHYVGTN